MFSLNTFNNNAFFIYYNTAGFFPLSCDDGHGDYNRSYEKVDDDFDYADYSTGKEDNNFRTRQKKKRKSEKQIIEDILNRWD